MKNKLILFISLFIGGGLSIFASSSPDGLEKVAEDKNFLESAVSHWPGLIPDYAMPGVNQEWLATALAGLGGTLIVFGIFIIIELIIKKFIYEL